MFDLVSRIYKIYIAILLLLFFTAYYYFRLDDSYIFYKYAKNIADGNGYVFNMGEKVNATTSPLYTFLLSFFYAIIKLFTAIDFVLIGNLISIVSIFTILFSAKLILKDEERFMFFAMIFLASPLIKFGFGMETFLNLALIFLSIYYYSEKKLMLASIFIGLSVLARFDSILFAAIIFCHYIFTNKKFPPILTFFIFLVTVAPWFIFSKFYFDSFFPTTISAKLSQSELGLFGEGLIFITNAARVLPGGYLTISALMLILFLGSFLIYKKKINIFESTGVNLLIIWSSLLFVFYAFIINAPPYQWYYTPFVVPVSLVFIYSIPYFIRKNALKNILLTILFLTACVLPVKNIIQGYSPKYLNLKNAAIWINDNSSSGDLLAADDIGILGFYYKNGKIADALGLINPEVSKHLVAKDFNWFLNNYSPEFVVHEYPRIEKHLKGDEATFWKKYEVKKIFESMGQKIAVYKRKV